MPKDKLYFLYDIVPYSQHRARLMAIFDNNLPTKIYKGGGSKHYKVYNKPKPCISLSIVNSKLKELYAINTERQQGAIKILENLKNAIVCKTKGDYNAITADNIK